MAISSRKISSFAERTQLDGSEYLMVAFNNRSYKVKTSLFTSDMIESITQQVARGDGESSRITITTSGGESFDFFVRNGNKGSKGNKGDTGNQGLQGNAGIALYNTDVEDMILDTLDGTKDGVELSDEELTTYGLSARQGMNLQNQLDLLDEEYLTQDDFDRKSAAGQIKNNVKYFIVEE